MWPVPTVSYQPVGGSSCSQAFEKGLSGGRSSGHQSLPLGLALSPRPCKTKVLPGLEYEGVPVSIPLSF